MFRRSVLNQGIDLYLPVLSDGAGGTRLYAEGDVAGFKDMAVVPKALKAPRRHLSFTDAPGPLTETQVGRADDACAFIKPAQEVEEQRTARQTEA